MRTIVAGSRGITDYGLVQSYLDLIHTTDWPITEVVSGTAKGPDQFGEWWAAHRGVVVRRFPADWLGNGRAAGVIRNVEMARYAEALVAFWDGKSRGTKHMIDVARARGLRVAVCEPEAE